MWCVRVSARAKAAAFPAAAALAAGAGTVWCYSRCEEERLKPWEERWQANRTSWHRDDVNPVLRKHLPRLIDPSASVSHGMGPRVLVPLCGKTLDMVYLSRQGYRVVGVEGVHKAIEEFAQEFGLQVPTAKGPTMHVNFPPELDPQKFRGHAVLISAGEDTRSEPPPPVILVEGDFLELGPEQAQALVPFEAAFDRGSLVAVDPSLRDAYAQALTHLVAPKGRVLLVAAEHDGFKDAKGPPFQVLEADVRRLFGKAFSVELLQKEDAMRENLAARGATRFKEAVYLLTKH